VRAQNLAVVWQHVLPMPQPPPWRLGPAILRRWRPQEADHHLVCGLL
jgi:hypothetical protein